MYFVHLVKIENHKQYSSLPKILLREYEIPNSPPRNEELHRADVLISDASPLTELH